MLSRQCLVFLVCCWSAIGAVDDRRLEVETQLAAANELFATQKHEAAKAAFAAVLKLDPDNAKAHFRLGLYACDAVEWEKALEHEARALAQQPDSAEYQFGWGAANGVAALKSGVFSKLGYARKCLAAYRRAAELEPGNVHYRMALFSYYQQAPGFAGGDKEEAARQAAEIRKLDAEVGRQAFAQLYMAQKKPDLAFREYEEFLRTAPDDYQALYSFGLLALFSGQRLEEGVAALRRCLNQPAPKWRPTHANVRWRISALLERQGKRDEARAELTAALALDPEFTPARDALKKLSPN